MAKQNDNPLDEIKKSLKTTAAVEALAMQMGLFYKKLISMEIDKKAAIVLTQSYLNMLAYLSAQQRRVPVSEVDDYIVLFSLGIKYKIDIQQVRKIYEMTESVSTTQTYCKLIHDKKMKFEDIVRKFEG